MAPKQQVQNNAQAQIRAFTTLMSEFGVLLEQETAALKKSDFPAVDALQPTKRKMAHLYQNGAQELFSIKDQVAVLDLGAKEEMIRARTAFTKTLHENLNAMEAVKSSAGRLIERIRSAMAAGVLNERQTNYSMSGAVRSWNSATAAVSFDSSL